MFEDSCPTSAHGLSVFFSKSEQDLQEQTPKLSPQKGSEILVKLGYLYKDIGNLWSGEEFDEVLIKYLHKNMNYYYFKPL